MPIKINGTNTAANPSITGSDTDTGIVYGSDQIDFSIGGSSKLTLDPSGRLLLGTTTEGQSSADDLTIATTGNTGITIRSGTSNTGNLYFSDGTSSTAEFQGFIEYNHSGSYLRFGTAASERMRIDSSGRVHIGTATNRLGEALHVLGQGITTSSAENTNMMLFGTFGGSDALIGAFSNIPVVFRQNNTERMRIDSSGKVGIGTSSPNSLLNCHGVFETNSFDNPNGQGGRYTPKGLLIGDAYSAGKTSSDDRNSIIWNERGLDIVFATNDTERMKIDSSGNLLVGTTSTTVESLTSAGQGVKLGQSGRMLEVASNDQPAVGFNRTGGDGTIVRLIGQGSVEGTISVSGSAVSYNGGHLSRWSQIKGLSTTDKSARPTIYQGTVMSNLDDLCVWEGEDNQQLNMTKVSDVVGDKDVAGVFFTWDDDDDKVVNDFYVAMTGDL